MSWGERPQMTFRINWDVFFCLFGSHRVDNLEQNFQRELFCFIYNNWIFRAPESVTFSSLVIFILPAAFQNTNNWYVLLFLLITFWPRITRGASPYAEHDLRNMRFHLPPILYKNDESSPMRAGFRNLAYRLYFFANLETWACPIRNVITLK